MAITYAQKNMLKEAYPLALVEEIPASRTLISLARIRKTINPSDIVTIVGGGNMGDMYADIELLRLMTVKSFPKNKIILFPQTIHYSKSKISTWLCRLSRKIYQGHRDILMMAREKVSYSTMKSLYPSTNVKLTPDIVMTLERGYDIKRKI